MSWRMRDGLAWLIGGWGIAMSRRIAESIVTRKWRRLATANPWLLPALDGARPAVEGRLSALDCSEIYARGMFAGGDLRQVIMAAKSAQADPVGLTPDAVSWFARWRSCRQVYRIDGEVAGELGEQGLDGSIPFEALGRLPYPIIYVDTKVDLPDDTAVGYLAWTQTDIHGRHALYLDFFSDEGLEWCTSMPFLEGQTLVQACRQMEEEAARASQVLGIEADRAETGDMESLLTPVLNTLLYINASEADSQTVYAPPTGGRGQRVGKRSGTETVRLVGAKMGHAIGAARREAIVSHGKDGAGERRHVAPHVRRAHWQGFWRGARRGREDGKFGDELVIKWVPPVYVNGDGSEIEVVHDSPSETAKRRK